VDVVRPGGVDEVRSAAAKQLAHYGESKPSAGKDKRGARYLCPICNVAFEKGMTGSADFVGNPQTHTNRGVSHGAFGYVVICMGCYYERVLGQILMGGRPAEVITLSPRLNLGPGKGEKLMRDVRGWVEAAKALMRGEVRGLEAGFSLGLTDHAARRVGERDPFTLPPGELASTFSYRFSQDRQKERRREALKRLKEEFDEDLSGVSEAAGEEFGSWNEAVEALMENRVEGHELRAIRREVFRLYETMQLICETPNLIFVPLRYQVAAGEDESETSKGLRRLYVSLLLSVVLDAAVAIRNEAERFEDGPGGAAYVPPVPAVRGLVGTDWIPVVDARRWLEAIGAASLLAGDTGLPKCSALYQVLSADPAERIARRIEEGGGRNVGAHHLRLIERLPGFRGGRAEETRA